MKLYNLTGVDITLVLKDGTKRSIPKERFTARSVQDEVLWDDTDGIPTSRLTWHISGLPAPQKDIVYIVQPGVLMNALISGRTVSDLRAPSNAIPGTKGEYEKLVSA